MTPSRLREIRDRSEAFKKAGWVATNTTVEIGPSVYFTPDAYAMPIPQSVKANVEFYMTEGSSNIAHDAARFFQDSSEATLSYPLFRSGTFLIF